MSTLLSINNYYYRRGGAEVVFLEQNRLMEEAGWRVVPFAMRHEKNLPSEWSDYFVEEIEFGEAYTLAEKAKRALKITYSLEARKNIARLIERVRPDVAHAHNIYHHISPSFFEVLHSRGVPTVLSLHDLKIACPAYKMLTHDGVCERCKGGKIWNVMTQRCIKNSLTLSAVILMESATHRLLGCYRNNIDRFVVPSRFYIDKLVEWGWPRERFVHVPNFIDTEQLRPEGEPGEHFVYCGRLGPEKGLATFVRAAALAGVKIQIIGTGPEEENLRRLAAECGAQVDFAGYRSGEELYGLLRRARALVLPSEWYENAPMSVMEAYALERPVIGAEIGGIPELVRPGQTGALFPSANIEALAERLREFAALPTNRILDMGREARQWIARDFSAEGYREQLLKLYAAMQQ